MTRSLHIRFQAEMDITGAALWYEAQRSELGSAFLDEIDAVLQRASQRPFQFPEIRDHVRRALLHRFPYSVYFQVTDEIVDVIAVLHQHRNPDTWQRRVDAG